MNATTMSAPTQLMQTDAPGDRGSRAGEHLTLFALLAVGAILRLAMIEWLPFEQDEIYTIIESRHLYDSPLHPGIHARPLYYLLQHVVLDLVPASHVSMRTLPFIFGIAGIVMTWALSNRHFGSAAAVVATTLVVVSPWHLHASGMARYWSLVYVLSAAFLYFLMAAGRHGRSLYYGGALVALLLGAAAHPTFVFPIAGIALGFHLVGTDGRVRWPWPDRTALMGLWLPAAIAFILAYVLLSSVAGSENVRNWDGRGLTASLRLLPAMIEWATPVVIAAAILGALVLMQSTIVIRKRFGFACLLGLLCGAGALLGASLFTDVYADYGIVMLPLAFVAIGGMVQEAVDRMEPIRSLAAASVVGLLFTAAVMPGTASYLSDGTRFDYRPAFARIAAAAPELPVVTAPIVLQRHYAPELNGVELQFTTSWLAQTLVAEQDLWLIAPVRRYGIWQDANGELAAWLVDHCRLDTSHERPRFDYRLYRTDLYRCTQPTS